MDAKAVAEHGNATATGSSSQSAHSWALANGQGHYAKSTGRISRSAQGQPPTDYSNKAEISAVNVGRAVITTDYADKTTDITVQQRAEVSVGRTTGWEKYSRREYDDLVSAVDLAPTSDTSDSIFGDDLEIASAMSDPLLVGHFGADSNVYRDNPGMGIQTSSANIQIETGNAG